MVDFNKFLKGTQNKMAVVSRNQTSNSNSNTNSKETEKKKELTSEVVDLSQLDKLPKGQVAEINKDADAWERLAPPPCPKGNRFRVKLFPAKDGAKRKEAEQGNKDTSYYTFDIEAKLIETKDEEFDGITVYCSGLHALSTRIQKRRDISTMAGLIAKLGHKELLKERMTDIEVLQAFNKVLKSEPMIYVELDWEAFSKNDRDKNGFSKKVFATFEDFPLVDSESGERVSEIGITNDDGGRETVNARLFVREWIGVSLDNGNSNRSGNNSSKSQGNKVVESLGDDDSSIVITKGKDDLDFENE